MNKTKKHLWYYPILFGLLGAFLGLIIRYFFAYSSISIPLKNIIHSHSHNMLLGLLFNALIILVYERFTQGMNKSTFRIFIAMQVCISGMLIAFIVQGYAFYSILFSTLHLWLSYVFVVKLWRNLNGDKQLVKLIKLGIVFHFISSLGPYCLGPLMVFGMQDSPWYKQAVFFYLHFQFFGALFLWFLAVFLKSIRVKLNNKIVLPIGLCIVGLFAHSLDFSFNHWLINVVGGISSIILALIIVSFYKSIKNQSKSIQVIYIILLILAFCNILGSFHLFADFVITNHFALIAWLHFIFLGLYLPFIWIESPITVSKPLWCLYFISVFVSELFLLFPELAYATFNISIMKLLFFAYLIVSICISIIHFRYLFLNYERHL